MNKPEKLTYRKIIMDGMNTDPAIPYTIDQIHAIVCQVTKPRMPGRASIHAEVNKMVHLNILDKFKTLEKQIVFRLAKKYMKANPFDMNPPVFIEQKDDPIAAYEEALKANQPEQPEAQAEPDPQPEASEKPAQAKKPPRKDTRKHRDRSLRNRPFPEFLGDMKVPLRDIATQPIQQTVLMAMVDRIYEQNKGAEPIITSGTLMVMAKGYFLTHQNMLFYIDRLVEKGRLNMELTHGIRVITKVQA